MKRTNKITPEKVNISGTKSADNFGIVSPFVVGLLVIGTGLCYAKISDLSLLHTIIMLACGLLSVVLSLIVCKKINALKPLAPFFPLVCGLVIFLVNINGVIGGGVDFYNSAVTLYNAEFSDAIALADVPDTASPLMFALVTITVIATLSSLVAHIKNPTGLLVLSLIFALPGLLLGSFSALGCAFLITAALGGGTIYSANGSALRRCAFICVLGAVLAATALLADNSELKAVDDARETVTETAHSIRYGSTTLPEGNLYKAYLLNTETDTALSVKISQAKDTYLRGFVGVSYSDGEWSGLNKAAFRGDSEGIAEWLSERGFSSATQYSLYLEASGSSENESMITISNKGTDREYFYVPYSVSDSFDEGYQLRDSSLKSSGIFGAYSYSYTESSSGQPSELLYAADWVSDPETDEQEEYVESESVYRAFVYENYLDVDEDLQEIIETLFVDSATDDDKSGVYHVTEHIREVLESIATYNKNAAEPDDSEDPIKSFLTEGVSGNASMYASAAVEAYRALGIPARYAEGYFIKADELTEHGESIDLTGENAHAWAEVYIDGLGWLPIDVTPGYYYEAYTLMEMVDKPRNVQRTAALDESGQDSAELPKSPSGSEPDKNKDKFTAKDAAALSLGILAAVIIAIGLAIAILEAIRLHRLLIFTSRFDKLDPKRRQAMVCAVILELMHSLGFEACYGWKADETDNALSGRFEEFYEGEFLRVNELAERLLYSDIPLRPEEVRMLNRFADKLKAREKSIGLVKRLKLRYRLSSAI